jgi:hypothetical protein
MLVTFVRIAAPYDALVLVPLGLLLVFLLIQFAVTHFPCGNSHELEVNAFFLFAKLLVCHHAHENLSRCSLRGFYIRLLCDELQLLNLLSYLLIDEVLRHEIALNDLIQL